MRDTITLWWVLLNIDTQMCTVHGLLRREILQLVLSHKYIRMFLLIDCWWFIDTDSFPFTLFQTTEWLFRAPAQHTIRQRRRKDKSFVRGYSKLLMHISFILQPPTFTSLICLRLRLIDEIRSSMFHDHLIVVFCLLYNLFYRMLFNVVASMFDHLVLTFNILRAHLKPWDTETKFQFQKCSVLEVIVHPQHTHTHTQITYTCRKPLC